MPLVKSSDVFIERSHHLLETNPTSTRITITYGSESKKQSKSAKVTKPTTEENKSFVSFKTYDPISGQLHKLKTFKTKELSKLLTALGPHGVTVTKKVKDTENKIQKENEQVNIRGFSSILVNSEIKEDESTPEATQPKSVSQAQSSTSGGSGSSKKNKKKKGKK